MFITPSFKKSLIEQFQGNYLKLPNIFTRKKVKDHHCNGYQIP